MKLKRVLLFCIFIFLQANLLGQNSEAVAQALKFKNISLEQGLSQSSVLCILQDHKGFLWFGTRDGLNKYDGNSFKVYRYDSQDSTSLSNGYIKSLFQDDKGTLWVGTRNGLNKYLPKNDTFKSFVHPDTNVAYKDEIWNIVSDDKDHLWVGTNYGLGSFDTTEEKYKYYVHNERDDTSLSNNLIRAFLRTEDGNLWIKTVGNIDFFDKRTKTFKHYSYPKGSPKEENISSKTTLYEDSKKNVWLGFDGGLSIYNSDSDRFEFFRLPPRKEIAITDAVRNIVEDDLGNLWVGTYRGLYVIDVKKSSISHFVHDENDYNSLAQNSIYSMHKDYKGDIWIGTYAGGLSYYDRNYDLFKHFSSGANNSKLNYKVVSSIVQDPDDNLWIGTEGGGINFYDKKTARFTYYTHQNNNPNSLSANNVKAMIRDRAGNYWIGTHYGGLNFLNPKKRPYSFKKYKNIPGEDNSLSDNSIISLFEDSQNKIWIGTSGGGINILDLATEVIIRVKDPSEVVGKIVYTISNGPEGTLLVGGDKGIAKLDKKTMELFPIPFTEGLKGSADPGGVLCTFIDNMQNIWIGTEGGGLFCYNENFTKSVNYGVSQGLPNDVVYGIVPDDSNNIWLSTNYGLGRLNLKTREFKNFDASDGLQGNEFNYGAYLKNKYGELLFGGTNGFTIFNPFGIKSNKYIPPVSIRSFKVNNKPFINVTDSLTKVTLKHHHNILNFDFVGLSYTQPNKNQYAYILEGFNEDWNYVGNRKSATYTNLDAGDYTFRIKASNNDGLWNPVGATLTITILPAPWRTWWAYSLYSILVLSALLIIRKYSLQRIHDINELKQERLEKERIEEVNKLKLQLFTNVSHDFRTPLTLIIGPLERMLKTKVGDDFIQKQHRIMHRNASVLMQLINQLLDFRKSESGKLQLHASKNDIISFVEDVKLAFEELSNRKQIDFSIAFSRKNINVWFDRIMLKKILFNLLSNAFKFTPSHGRIQVEIDADKSPKKGMPEGCAKIKVRDSGKGIPKEKINFIFERFYQYDERFGTGIGLALTKSLVELHRGSIKAKSKQKKGTSFTITLPLGNSHLTKNQILYNVFRVEENYFYNVEGFEYLDEEHSNQDTKVLSEETFDSKMPSILLVEDNAEVRTFIRGIFQKTSNIFEATNGKNAFELAKNKNIDIIISDIMMPIMDGMELCHEIKSNIRTSHIPVILLTARTSEEYTKSGYRIGADAYITKPFDSEILEVRVNNLLKSRQDLIDKFKKNLILQPKELTITSTDELFLQKALDIVEVNMTNSEFSTHLFISEMCMSRSVLYRKLKTLTDQSISEFIRTIKLKRAAQLMKQTQMTISEIAFDLGFNDKKYFRESFQKMFDELPSKYRSKYRK